MCSDARECNHEDLADKFEGNLEPSSDVPCATCTRLETARKKFKRGTIREQWILDLYNLRNDLAHGKVAQRYPSIWTLHEHLLLASFAFPLVVKSRLAAIGVYSMTERDQCYIDSLEHLACIENLMEPLDKHRTRWPWVETLWRVKRDLDRARSLKVLEEINKARKAGVGETE